MCPIGSTKPVFFLHFLALVTCPASHSSQVPSKCPFLRLERHGGRVYIKYISFDTKNPLCEGGMLHKILFKQIKLHGLHVPNGTTFLTYTTLNYLLITVSIDLHRPTSWMSDSAYLPKLVL